jgi:hypothetical protein
MSQLNLSPEITSSPRRWKPPTPEEWIAYANQINWPRDDAEAAYDHYLACGWRIGSKPMRDWQAAARNCKRRSPMFSQGRQPASKQGAASLGALQMQLKAVTQELDDLTYPGGCNYPAPLTGEKKAQADALRAKRLAIKAKIDRITTEP